MRRPAIAALVFAAFAFPLHDARAQTAEDCFQATLKDDDLAIIRVCTQALEKANLTTEDRSITLSNRGLGYLRNKEFDKAIIDLSDSLLVNPKNPFAFSNRGDAWLEKKNYDRALADFDEALKVDTGFTSAMYSRGLTFERQGNVNGARIEYRRALATTGERPIDKWARDRAKERLTALGETPPQRDTNPRVDDRRSTGDSETRTMRDRDDRPSNTGRGSDGSYTRRK